MDYTNYMRLGYGMNTGFPAVALPLFIIFLVWSVFWKGLALWNSAKRGEKVWFVVLLLVNTLGILEIVYLFAVAKIRFSDLLKS